jgi:hypothetical protein
MLGMDRDIESRIDELTFGYGDGAADEAILRVQDSVEVGARMEGQRWLSTVFQLVRSGKVPGSTIDPLRPEQRAF